MLFKVVFQFSRSGRQAVLNSTRVLINSITHAYKTY
jgi:hypothetical protein